MRSFFDIYEAPKTSKRVSTTKLKVEDIEELQEVEEELQEVEELQEIEEELPEEEE